MSTMGILLERQPPPCAARTRLATAVMTLVAALAMSAAAQTVVTEQQVKAAYLFNFTQFATWPLSAFDGPAGQFRVCTVGEDGDLGPVLAETLRNETVGGHPLTLVRNPPAGDLPRCHLLFISARTHAPEMILAQVARAPVLTVGDGEGFDLRGGMLAFIRESGRIRFDVNLPAATARGITLSSRLLQVARKVQQ
jgi:hypothetical protein